MGRKGRKRLQTNPGIFEDRPLGDGLLEKLWGREGNFRAAGIFLLSNCLNEFFLGHSMNIFLGLIGVHEFFSFNFTLRGYFFCTLPPPPPISFLMVPPLACHA